MKISRDIDVLESISETEFEQRYFKPQRPLVLKNFAASTPAGSKWTIEHLKDICGDVNVDIFNSENKNSKASAYTKADLRMSFSSYAGIIQRNEPSSLRMFLFNMFRHKPELRKDFPCPSIFKGILGKIGHMFFGSRDTKVRIHQDIDMSSVLLTQFEGRKKILLIHPRFSPFLYRLPFNTYSLINPDRQDKEKYPALEFVEAQECILDPGDALFMPGGYWHYITYMDSGFAVSYRRLSPGLKLKLKGFASLVLYMPFDKLMNNLLQEKWLTKKEKMAEKRANKAVIQFLLDSEIPFRQRQMDPA
jgi:hypothetical protein